ncbi:hypothetical protein D3C78_1411820 [compost metagenome]
MGHVPEVHGWRDQYLSHTPREVEGLKPFRQIPQKPCKPETSAGHLLEFQSPTIVSGFLVVWIDAVLMHVDLMSVARINGGNCR